MNTLFWPVPHRIFIFILSFAIVFGPSMVQTSFGQKKHGHFLGPVGGSYHRSGKIRVNGQPVSICSEWFLLGNGEISMKLRCVENGRLVTYPLTSPNEFTIWMTPVGLEGGKAKKVILKKIALKTKNKNESDTTFVSKIPEKWVGQNIFIVVPEFSLNRSTMRWAGLIHVQPKEEDKND